MVDEILTDFFDKGKRGALDPLPSPLNQNKSKGFATRSQYSVRQLSGSYD
jgi:hypothetical protein